MHRTVAVVFFLNAAFAQAVKTPVIDYDFGVVRQGERVSHVFALRNTSDEPLRIDRIEPDVAGVTARFPKQVAPGGQANVTLEWNTAQETGKAEGSATVFANGGSPHQIFRFRAQVQPPIEFQPFGAVFFTAYKDQSPEKSVEIINHEQEPLVIRKVEAPERFDVKLEEVQPGREFRLRVKVRSGGAPGRSTEPIYLLTDNPQHPRLQVNANLFVKGDLYAFPEDVSFGGIQMSGAQDRSKTLEYLSQTTVITNRGGPVELRSVSSDLPFVRVTREPASGPSDKFLLKVELDPAKLASGEFHGSLKVVTSDPKHPEITIPVTATIR